MRYKRPSVTNPLSFSLLDLVMGLVSVILIGAFAIASQPSRGGQVNPIVRSLLVEQKSAGRDDSGPSFGVAVFKEGEWVFSHRGSSSDVKFSSLGAGSSKQQVFLLFDSIPSDARLLIYLSTPRIRAGGGVDPSERAVTFALRAIDGGSSRIVVRDRKLSADHPIWEHDLQEIFR